MTRLYLRIILLMAGLVVATIIVLLVVLAKVDESYFRPRSAEEMRALAIELEDRLRGLDPSEARAALSTMDDQVVFDVEVIAPDDFAARVVDRRDDESAVFYLRPPEASFVLRLSPDAGQLAAFQRRQGGYFSRSMLVIGAMVLVSGLILVAPLLRRLRAQERTILRIAEGDFEARVPVDSKDALGRLGMRLNEMAARVEALMSSQRDLLHAVSHELRTPAARIRFGLDLLNEADDESERRRRTETIHADVTELEQLLDELLAFLRNDTSSVALELEPVAIEPIVRGIVDRSRTLRPGIAVECAGDATAQVMASPRLIARAIGNVALNAMRHARGAVRIEWRRIGAGDQLELAVDDDGEGVPEQERERIFDPFVRLDESRDRDSGGVGLGLSIARRVAERHGGSLDVIDSPLGGARFRFRLPCARDDVGG